MALGNRFDNAPFDGFVSNLGGCPVTDETLRRFMGTDQRQQRLALSFAKGNSGRIWAGHMSLLWMVETSIG
jgi:hypothetical protein